MTSISLKTYLGKENIINDDFNDIADFMESVTALFFAAGYSLQTIREGYEDELERVKDYIQSSIDEEQQTTENNE